MHFSLVRHRTRIQRDYVRHNDRNIDVLIDKQTKFNFEKVVPAVRRGTQPPVGLGTGSEALDRKRWTWGRP